MHLAILRGDQTVVGPNDDDVGDGQFRQDLAEFVQLERLAVLFGAGASMHLDGPNIRAATKESVEQMCASAGAELSDALSNGLQALMGDATSNLERLLERLAVAGDHLAGWNMTAGQLGAANLSAEEVRGLFSAINRGLAHACNLPGSKAAGEFKNDPWSAHRAFLAFLATARPGFLRPVDLFTTNYDLAIENALDELAMPYADGFVGTVQRALRLETYDQVPYWTATGTGRLRRVDGFTRLYKIHGSIHWRARGSPTNSYPSVFQTRVTGDDSGELALIYPTPAKAIESVGYPYGDLIRRFSETIGHAQTGLICIGYGFQDEHVNRVVYQSLRANPSLQLLVLDPFGVEKKGDRVSVAHRLSSLCAEGAKRVTFVGGDAARFIEVARLVRGAEPPRPTTADAIETASPEGSNP